MVHSYECVGYYGLWKKLDFAFLSWCIFWASFLACGFLIHLSNKSDSPRFRAPWKKIRQKYGTQQEPSLFKGHPLSCKYGDALCSMIPTKERVSNYGLCKKIDFPFLSLGGPRHGARVWCLGWVPKHRNQWQEVEGLLFSPENCLVSRPSAKA